MAPTRGGWREPKLAAYQVRPRGAPAEVTARADRALPRPAASVGHAMLADCRAFAARWRPWAEGLGLDPDGELTVLAGGAPRTWAAAEAQLPAAGGLLDIFHASGHLARAAGALHGEGTAEAAGWHDGGRAAPLAGGWRGLLDHVGATPVAGRTPAGQAALDDLLGYFAAHVGRLGYAARLREGRSIGSGAVEGLARRMGRRLKGPGRGWCADHIDGIAALVATVDAPEWDTLWSRPAA